MQRPNSSLRRVLRGHLSEPATYILAAVVGTLINLYGHALVPYLHGEQEPLAAFTWKLIHEPLIMASSIGIAYLFPFLVGCFSSVRTQLGLACPRCDEPMIPRERDHA